MPDTGFKKDDLVKIVSISGDYRYGYIQDTSEKGQHLSVCMHDEGESKLSYDTAAMTWIGMAPPDWAKQLSKTEKSILQWLAQDHITDKKMAEMLGLSPNTIRAHVRNLRLKLKVDDRVQLRVLASGLVKHLN